MMDHVMQTTVSLFLEGNRRGYRRRGETETGQKLGRGGEREAGTKAQTEKGKKKNYT